MIAIISPLTALYTPDGNFTRLTALYTPDGTLHVDWREP